jgi:transitional endoplasmic reticulum ATPase
MADGEFIDDKFMAYAQKEIVRQAYAEIRASFSKRILQPQKLEYSKHTEEVAPTNQRKGEGSVPRTQAQAVEDQDAYYDEERDEFTGGNGDGRPRRKSRWTAKNVTIERSKEVKQILIPDGMSLREASRWLERKDQEEDKEVGVYHEIDCFPLDGAVAFIDALDDIYGFVAKVNTPGFWGQSNPPTMIGVPTGPNTSRQVPWGRVEIPGVAGYLNTSMKVTTAGPRFLLEGETKQRHLHEIEAVVERIKERLKTHSIYKGQAIKLDLSWIRNGGPRAFDPTGHAPKFSIPVDKVVESDLIFPEAVERDIDLGLFTPIECTDQCRKHGVPLKRGVLLAGDYGTGKTLTAYVTAKKAVNNGFTFIYLANVLDLAQAFQFAAMYAPAVVFAEDVDRVLGQDERTEAMDAILNSFDGVDTKTSDLITVLTTNHLDRLSQAILRPGRCDTLVQVTRPDADAAARLVQLYGRGLIATDADFGRIGEALADHLPAEIREAVERAKLAAIRRLSREGKLKKKTDSIQGEVREQDVLAAVSAMEAQHKLLEPKNLDNRSPVEKAAEQLGFAIRGGMEANGYQNAEAAIKLLQRLGVADAENLNSVEAEYADDVS